MCLCPRFSKDGLQIFQERVQNRTPVPIVDVPVPQLIEAPVDVLLSTPQKSVLNHTQEQIVGVPLPPTIEASLPFVPL